MPDASENSLFTSTNVRDGFGNFSVIGIKLVDNCRTWYIVMSYLVRDIPMDYITWILTIVLVTSLAFAAYAFRKLRDRLKKQALPWRQNFPYLSPPRLTEEDIVTRAAAKQEPSTGDEMKGRYSVTLQIISANGNQVLEVGTTSETGQAEPTSQLVELLGNLLAEVGTMTAGETLTLNVKLVSDEEGEPCRQSAQGQPLSSAEPS